MKCLFCEVVLPDDEIESDDSSCDEDVTGIITIDDKGIEDKNGKLTFDNEKIEDIPNTKKELDIDKQYPELIGIRVCACCVVHEVIEIEKKSSILPRMLEKVKILEERGVMDEFRWISK